MSNIQYPTSNIQPKKDKKGGGMSKTVIQYVLSRLKALGVSDVFNITGSLFDKPNRTR